MQTIKSSQMSDYNEFNSLDIIVITPESLQARFLEETFNNAAFLPTVQNLIDEKGGVTEISHSAAVTLRVFSSFKVEETTQRKRGRNGGDVKITGIAGSKDEWGLILPLIIEAGNRLTQASYRQSVYSKLEAIDQLIAFQNEDFDDDLLCLLQGTMKLMKR